MPNCDNCGTSMAYIPSSNGPYWLCSKCHSTKSAIKSDVFENEPICNII